MTISILIPTNFNNEEGKNKLKAIFYQQRYPIEKVEIDSFYNNDAKLLTIAYLDIQDKTLENEVIQHFKESKPKLTQRFELRPQIFSQEISINLSNDSDLNKEKIEEICCEEAKGKLANKNNPIRIKEKCAYVDLENLEEANKVVNFLKNNYQTLKVQLKDSELEKAIKKRKSNNYSNQNRDEQRNIEDFYKNSDYALVADLVNSFLFLLCNHLSDIQSEKDQK